jgi:hypothetical protein
MPPKLPDMLSQARMHTGTHMREQSTVAEKILADTEVPRDLSALSRILLGRRYSHTDAWQARARYPIGFRARKRGRVVQALPCPGLGS